MNILVRTTLVRTTLAFAALAMVSAAQASCDEKLGETAFNKCAACHSIEGNDHLAGPSLKGLKGRTAGSVAGFVFSPAMEDADFAWDAQALSAFLESPMEFLPGNAMPFGGLKNPEQRAALVCYLLSPAS